MANNSFSYGFYSDDANKPSILAGVGPYNSMIEAITGVLAEYQDITLSGTPPLGHKFCVKENNVATWYTYKSGNFELSNVGQGIVAEGSGGGNGTITDVKKGTTSQSTTLVTNNIAYIPMAEAPVNNVGGADGLMSKEDKAKLDKLIEVLEDGLFNVDANFEVEGGDSSGSNAELEAKVNRIIAILGDLYNSGGNDAHFEVTETV